MTRALTVVLGGSGDIGSVLVARLKKNQDRFLAPTSKQVDLTSTTSTKSFFSSISDPYSVVFAAFLDRRQGDNEQTLDLNLLMVENIVNFAKPRSLVFLSSMDVYGKSPKLPITEDTQTDETSFYSRAKLLAEFKLSQTFAEKTPLLVIRLPGVYGGQGPRNAALDRILAKGIKERLINIGGGGSLLRDWIYAGEVARFLIDWFDKPVSGTFNFVTGTSWTIDRYISECLSETGEIRHEIKQVDETEKFKFGADHIFDNKHLTEVFTDWTFENRSSSLKTFSKLAQDHLNALNIEPKK